MPTAPSNRPISMPAKPMNVTTSAVVAWPRPCSQAPRPTTDTVAAVLATRFMTLMPAHQASTGNWWRTTSPAKRPKSAASSGARPKARISGALPSTSPTWQARAECASSARRCPASVRRIVSVAVQENTMASTTSTAPSAGFR